MKVGPAFLQTFASQATQSVASVAAAVVVARALGPAGQGRYALFVAAVGLFATVGAIGQFESHVFTSAGGLSSGRILFLRSLLQSLVAGVILVVTNVIWRNSLAVEHQDALAVLLGLVLVCEVLALLFRGINLGQHRITAYNVANLVQRLGFLAGVILLSLLRRPNVVAVVAAWLGAVALNVLLSGFLIWRRSGPVEVSWSAVGNGWVDSLLGGLRALITIVLTLLLVRSDVYMLSSMLGARAVGQVSVASTFAEYLWYIPSILSSVLFAAVAARRGPETVAQLCRASRTTIALLGPIAIALMLVGRPLVPMIFGKAYLEAGTLFVLLVPGTLAISLHLVIDSYFAGSGFPPITYGAVAVALVLKIALNLIAVPRLGITGAVTVTSLVYICLLTTKVIAFRRATGVPLGQLLRPTWDDIRYAMTVGRRWVQRLGPAADAKS